MRGINFGGREGTGNDRDLKVMRSIDHFREHARADKKTRACADSFVHLLTVQNCSGADQQVVFVRVSELANRVSRTGETVGDFDRAKSAIDDSVRRSQRSLD